MDENHYYLPSEVILHNKPDDIWVTFSGNVYDVTPVLKEVKDKEITEVLLAAAGKDISLWFNPRKEEGIKVNQKPHKPVPRGTPVTSSTSSSWFQLRSGSQDVRPWWLDKSVKVGKLTKKARPIKVLNSLAPASHNTSLIWVAAEETLDDISKRIQAINSNISGYTMKFHGRVLHMMKTLDENNIPDERDKFTQLGMTDDDYIPTIILFYNDDFTKN